MHCMLEDGGQGRPRARVRAGQVTGAGTDGKGGQEEQEEREGVCLLRRRESCARTCWVLQTGRSALRRILLCSQQELGS